MAHYRSMRYGGARQNQRPQQNGVLKESEKVLAFLEVKWVKPTSCTKISTFSVLSPQTRNRRDVREVY